MTLIMRRFTCKNNNFAKGLRAPVYTLGTPNLNISARGFDWTQILPRLLQVKYFNYDLRVPFLFSIFIARSTRLESAMRNGLSYLRSSFKVMYAEDEPHGDE